jgi:hypothetical protein
MQTPAPTDTPAIRGEKQWDHYTGHDSGRDMAWENNSDGIRAPYIHSNLQTQDANIGPEKVHVLQTKHATYHTTYFDKANMMWRYDPNHVMDQLTDEDRTLVQDNTDPPCDGCPPCDRSKSGPCGDPLH